MSVFAVTALLVLSLAGPPVVTAASFTLEPQQKSDALRAGARSITLESFDAGAIRIDNSSASPVSIDSLTVDVGDTSFNTGGELWSELTVPAEVGGPREDFARFYAPRILFGDREIEPSFVQNERTAVRTDAGAYLARCVYGFPTKELTPKARLLLVVRDADGREVDRFTIDLAAMR